MERSKSFYWYGLKDLPSWDTDRVVMFHVALLLMALDAVLVYHGVVSI